MTLTEWQSNGWLRPHKSSRNEIEGLFSIVDRDLNDAISKDLSCDWKFGIVEYDMAGVASESEAIELIEFATEFRTDVLNWLTKHHQNLVPQDRS